MRETWYVLENNDLGDPCEVAPDHAGILRHSSGVAVAMRGSVPSSRGCDPDEERAKSKPPKTASRELKPEMPSRGYKTRDTKPDA